MLVKSPDGKPVEVTQEQAEHLRRHGVTLEEWQDNEPATDEPEKRKPGRPRKRAE